MATEIDRLQVSAIEGFDNCFRKRPSNPRNPSGLTLGRDCAGASYV